MSFFIYIVSSPHGGSTLFSHVLGKHPEMLNLGEVSFVPKLLALEELCSCGDALRECVWWGQVFAGLAESTGNNLVRDPYSLYLGDAPKDKRGSGRSLCIHNNHNIALSIALFQCVYSVFRSYMFCFNVCIYAFHSVYVDDNSYIQISIQNG
jgi:hypothetical protein